MAPQTDKTDSPISAVRTVVRADILGYCMGVRRAVEAAEMALNSAPKGTSVYTLGPLIHNPSVLESLGRRGLTILRESEIDSINSQEHAVVIIRAHGVPPDVRQKLEQKNCTIVDATCPRVLANQKRAAVFAERGCHVIIAGDKNHGEVAAVAGYAGRHCAVIENTKRAEEYFPQTPAVLLSQTTISRSEYAAVAEILRGKMKDLQVLDTICPATEERQNALRRLCGQVSGVLVIGGRRSANTQRLFTTAEELCPAAALIESADDIPPVFFTFPAVGLTAGASTPDDVIDSVEQALLHHV
ncbi:MAG: 4-hydroxy-3-methylbut-2-enyl diphosphate reductase [Bacteroides sp.]|nr:4-hydroxy-3-methylbut-2-enyl diphosphate reductase [Prevotella sp.]MCM1407486.1 4-hydroxy-3-methylbut-2-enyl diphosphate reductase [Treponema brennaborense]MCM1469976.1 4-hydroxy-3-methylbut-2-enyl diphosphate reductase [Bacteroides sp.]